MRYFTVLLFMFFIQNLLAQEDFHLKEIENKIRLFSKLQQDERSATANQQKFDVNYYGLDVEVLAPEKKISGNVLLKAKVTDGPLANVELDLFDNMTVDSVLDSQNKLSFNHENDLLDISLARIFDTNEEIALTIYYRGDPSASGSGAFEFGMFDGKPHFWTLSEPYGAREWWPCKDVPEDKADSADIYVTVPEGLLVASNGILQSQQTLDGKTTFHWKERYPIVSYLVSLAGYEYVHYTEYYQTLTGEEMPIEFYVYPDHYENEAFRNSYAQTKDMISAFANLFGEYPFVQEKYGHAEFLGGGGMEHQTCTSLDGYSEDLISHELAHQWWGDMITCRDFHHIWLNEGFATYCEALWIEYTYGTASYHDKMDENIYKGSGTVYVEDDTQENDIFNYSLSYKKASYVLHMLRHVVGDDTFFDILKTYYADQRYRYATAVTEDFQELCRQVSGINLQKYFQQWIYGEYYPHYQYSWTSSASGDSYKIDLNIEQVQSNTGPFWMPVDVNIQTAGGDTVIVVWDSLAAQNFELTVKDEPQMLELDKDGWILKDAEEIPSGFYPAEAAIDFDFRIVSAYPNPFNPMLTVEFELAAQEELDIAVFNLLGEKVAAPANKRFYSAGRHRVPWNAADFPSGIYYISIRSGVQMRVCKVVYMK